jgi:drug/metabolite transporter (DMT)-like permease
MAGNMKSSLPSCCATIAQMLSDREYGSGNNGRRRRVQSSDEERDPFILFGVDISSCSRTVQFLIPAGGLITFTVIYGYYQELVAVHIAGREFGLCLATFQFLGYTIWSAILNQIGSSQKLHREEARQQDPSSQRASSSKSPASPVPLRIYFGLSLLRALDLAMATLAMRFITYPTKVLMKSTRVVFTMILGVFIGNKTYRCRDYAAAGLLVLGLAMFLHADTRDSSVVFHPAGIVMMVVSLLCDGTFGNWSEKVMREYRVGHDEFQVRLYLLAFLALASAALVRGELISGVHFFYLQDGTFDEITEHGKDGIADWAIRKKEKIMALFFFSTAGLFGSSCAGAITKHSGALAFSLTSTARKAITLFLSFALFHNTCTLEHIAGMTIFLSALLLKSIFSMSKRSGNDRSSIDSRSRFDGATCSACGGDVCKGPLISDEESTCSTATMDSINSGDDVEEEDKDIDIDEDEEENEVADDDDNENDPLISPSSTKSDAFIDLEASVR